MGEREPFGKRIGRFFLMMGALVVIVGGVIVYIKVQGLSSDAQGVVIGMVVGGVLVLVPIGAVGVIALLVTAAVLRRQQARQTYQQPAQPAVVVVSGGQLQQPQSAQPGWWPGYGAVEHPALPMRGHSERTFEIFGEE